ncbi:MAG: ribonuclease HI [Anaerolineae bacterium]|nr:ribonuclease HI [Anaerolineae bacterium]
MAKGASRLPLSNARSAAANRPNRGERRRSCPVADEVAGSAAKGSTQGSPREEPDPESNDRPHVDIFTDGGAIGNPGPGGYGVILRCRGKERQISGGFRLTTNNRMELMAAIVGLEALKRPSKVTIHTDSQYLANAMTRNWARKWRAQGWMRGRGRPALNPDLWERLLELVDRHEVRFHWIRGHAGHPENERADRLSMQAASRPDLPADEGYRGEE